MPYGYGRGSFSHGDHNLHQAYEAGKLPLRTVTDSVVMAPLQGITSMSPLES